MRKEYHRDIHMFARRILDEDNYASIQGQAEEYFSRVYFATPKTFSHPEWIPECPQPFVPITTAPFMKIRGVISGLKSSSTPYIIIKRGSSLLPAQGWHSAPAGQEDNRRLPPHYPDVMCQQGLHQPGEEKVAVIHCEQQLPKHSHPEGLH